MRECYISKVASKQARLIAKIKLEKSVNNLTKCSIMYTGTNKDPDT